MRPSDVLALPGANWKAEYLEDTSVRRITLEQYERESHSIYRYLVSLGVEPENAKEIVQDAFLKLHEHLLTNGDRTNLRAWLYRVSHNLARNIQVSARLNKTGPLPDSGGRDPAADGVSVEEELLARERLERLRRVINQLSASQRECLLLRAQGLKYREIAEVLNLSTSTVGENIQRGLARLKDLL